MLLWVLNKLDIPKILRKPTHIATRCEFSGAFVPRLRIRNFLIPTTETVPVVVFLRYPGNLLCIPRKYPQGGMKYRAQNTCNPRFHLFSISPRVIWSAHAKLQLWRDGGSHVKSPNRITEIQSRRRGISDSCNARHWEFLPPAKMPVMARQNF